MKVMLDNGAYMPERGHDGDAGLDLRTPKWVIVPAHGYATIDTGVHMEIPKGFYGKLESKSGLNVKHSVVSLGGVIDSGYTGSIVAKLYNLSDVDYLFEPGDKVVQIIIQPCEYPKLELTDSFEETERGNGGFGSTGR
jgi:dUTP pyrophosphatase